jgi:hypothetical protein
VISRNEVLVLRNQWLGAKTVEMGAKICLDQQARKLLSLTRPVRIRGEMLLAVGDGKLKVLGLPVKEGPVSE